MTGVLTKEGPVKPQTYGGGGGGRGGCHHVMTKAEAAAPQLQAKQTKD